MAKGVLLVLSGFSGAGKGTIVKQVVKENDNIALSVSMTTRDPRPGEVDGKDYFFVTKERFEEAIENNELIEHACYVGNYYGTPKKYVEEQLESGRDVILEIELQGALQVKDIFPDAVLVFVTTPTGEILKERLTGRGTETKEVIDNRMSRASEEADFMEKYDYLLVNDVLEDTIKELNVIMEAKRHSPKCNMDFINKIKKELKAFK